MKKIGYIAAREFVATVGTRGFIVGLLVMPVLITLFAIIGPRLLSQRSFRAVGQIAIVDPTGVVAGELRTALDPAAIAARRERDARLLLAQVPDGVRSLAQPAARSLESTLGQIPDLRVVERPSGGDLQQEKEWLREQRADAERHLAVAVIHANAVTPRPGDAGYGAYDLYIAPNLDDRVDNAIQQNLRFAILAARARGQQLDRDRIDALMRLDRVRPVTVTKDAEQQAFGPLNRVLPFAFMFILFFGVMMGGQNLMTSTIEEKSNRVVEVLLSAVSPFELMAGKILGQMGASLVALALYVVMGLALLVSFALLGLMDVRLLFYLVIFFVIAFLVIGSLMAAIGGAVNEMKEAQSLMAPIMVLLVLPLMLQVPIAQNPNSAFSTVISFIPPLNTFTMLIRLASSAPPPLWQVWLSIAVGVASVFAAVWFAAKVFSIGLLMYGKPPNLATLMRWVKAS